MDNVYKDLDTLVGEQRKVIQAFSKKGGKKAGGKGKGRSAGAIGGGKKAGGKGKKASKGSGKGSGKGSAQSGVKGVKRAIGSGALSKRRGANRAEGGAAGGKGKGKAQGKGRAPTKAKGKAKAKAKAKGKAAKAQGGTWAWQPSLRGESIKGLDRRAKGGGKASRKGAAPKGKGKGGARGKAAGGKGIGKGAGRQLVTGRFAKGVIRSIGKQKAGRQPQQQQQRPPQQKRGGKGKGGGQGYGSGWEPKGKSRGGAKGGAKGYKGADGGGRSGDDRRLFFANAPWNMTAVELQRFFEEAGEVVNVKLYREYNGDSKGMGQVTYARSKDAQWALQRLSRIMLDGYALHLQVDSDEAGKGGGKSKGKGGGRSGGPAGRSGGSGSDYARGRTVYFANASYMTSASKLTRLFEKAGQISRFQLYTGPTGASRGMGVVEYADREGARYALERLHESDVDGRVITVDVYAPDE